jgi:hypothetical protein
MQDKEKILTMVAEGKITAEEAEKLINALNANRKEQKPGTSLVKLTDKIRNSSPFQGKIIVEIKSAKGENVKIKLPLKLANLALNMIPKDKLSELDQEGVNLKEIIGNISGFVNEIDDDILNITSAGGDSIRVFIER